LFTFFQLFVYNSAVCLLFLSFCKQTADFSAKIRFWLFWTKLTPVQRQYPFSVFVNKQLTLFTFFSCLFTFCQLFVYILSAVCLLFLSFQLFVYFFLSFSCLFTFLSAVCLHFVSCLFTFLSFCKQTADFSVFSCLFTFFQVLTFLNEVDPSPTPVPVLSFCKQTADFVYFFSVFSCLFTFSVSCLFTFLSFCKQTADYSSKSGFWLFWTKLTLVQCQYPFFSVFRSILSRFQVDSKSIPSRFQVDSKSIPSPSFPDFSKFFPTFLNFSKFVFKGKKGKKRGKKGKKREKKEKKGKKGKKEKKEKNYWSRRLGSYVGSR